MKGLKKTLVLLAGLVMFLCANPVLAEDLVIDIPYAVHGGDWWSGLALANTGPSPITVELRTTHAGSYDLVGEVSLSAFSQEVKLLPEFFTEEPYPTENGGRVALTLDADGDNAEKDFKCTLFVGSSDGFSFQSYDRHNSYD